MKMPEKKHTYLQASIFCSSEKLIDRLSINLSEINYISFKNQFTPKYICGQKIKSTLNL